jgi:hypothetical protein
LFAQRNEPKKGPPFTWYAFGELPCAARKEQATSESRFTPPSRYFVLCCAAQLREMALKNQLSAISGPQSAF